MFGVCCLLSGACVGCVASLVLSYSMCWLVCLFVCGCGYCLCPLLIASVLSYVEFILMFDLCCLLSCV